MPALLDAAAAPSSLAHFPSGSRGRLVSIDAGHGLRARLASMGLVPGVEIEIVRNGGRGPYIVCAHGARLVLGRGVAHKILIRP